MLGTGLTAVDSALTLLSHNAGTQVYMLSRRGKISQCHELRAPGIPPPVEGSAGLREIVRRVRQEVKSLQSRELPWHGALDALRPLSNRLWQNLSHRERLQFTRHIRTYWENHRHRMAPEIWRKLQGFMAEGRLHVLAGRLLGSCRTEVGPLQLSVRLADGGHASLEVDRAINCTGLHEDYRNSPRPLIRSLMQSGIGIPNSMGTGFQTDENGRLAGRESRVFTLGPPRRGDLFETTAVPEIRAQAEALAAYLAQVCIR